MHRENQENPEIDPMNATPEDSILQKVKTY